MSTPTAQPELTNDTIAAGLEEIARLLAFDPIHPSRCESLRSAAEKIRASATPVTQLIDERSVEGVHSLNIDYELCGVVTDWVRSGRLPWLERLKAQRREEIAELPSIGPGLARELCEVLHVSDIDGLAVAVREGRLANVCGFGPKRTKLVTHLLESRVGPIRVRRKTVQKVRSRPSTTRTIQNAEFEW